MLLGKGDESLASVGVGPAIDDQHGLGRAGLFQAQRIAGGNDGDNAEAIEAHAIELAFVDLPAKDGVFAAEVHLGIGETGARPDVAGAGFDIRSRNSGRRQRSHTQQHGERSRRKTRFIVRNLLGCIKSPKRIILDRPCSTVET